MIGIAAQDLVTKLKAIPGAPFGTPARVGLALGASKYDPNMEKIQVPNVWVVFINDVNNQPTIKCTPTIELNFIVKIQLSYTTEQDLIVSQLPILEKTIKAVHGQPSPNGFYWIYRGSQLDTIQAGKAVFDQQYSLTVSL